MKYLAVSLIALLVVCAPSRAFAQGCCNSEPDKIDFFHKGTPLDSLGLSGRYTADDRRPHAEALMQMGRAVVESLAKHGVHSCREQERVGGADPQSDDDWYLGLNGRAPHINSWSTMFDCGAWGRVEVHLMAEPFSYQGSSDKDWSVTSSGHNFLWLRWRSSESPDAAGTSSQEVVIGEIDPLPNQRRLEVPSWARPHSMTVHVFQARADLLPLLDIDVLAKKLTTFAEGPLLGPAHLDGTTQLSELERHTLDRAVYAAILPEHPWQPTSLSNVLTDYQDKDLQVFLRADLGLSPSMVQDFLLRAKSPQPFPKHVSPGERALIDAAKWNRKSGPLVTLSPVGFSADHTHAMVFVSARYEYGRRSGALLVLKADKGRWTIEYSRGYTIC